MGAVGFSCRYWAFDETCFMDDCGNKLTLFESWLVSTDPVLMHKFGIGGLGIRWNNGDCELMILAADHLYRVEDEKNIFARWREFRIGLNRR